MSAETSRTWSGLDVLRGILSGDLPSPPIGETLGFALAEVAPGRAVFSGTPGVRHGNPLGTVHGGYVATLLDSCMSCAVHTTLPVGTGYTTIELKVNFVRAVTRETGPLEERVIHAGSRIATAEGRLVAAEELLYAHGTTTCLVFPL